jgi:hypothetical protein
MTIAGRAGSARRVAGLVAATLVLAMALSACGGTEPVRRRPDRSPRSHVRPSPTIAPVSPAPPSPFACTVVIGFSQTSQWYKEGFESQVEDASWQLFFHDGAGISTWANPDSGMWTRAELYSPCAERSADPDRVLLTVSEAEYLDDASAWQAFIEQAVQTIRAKYPGATSIILQPVVGGPDGARCDHNGVTVRATFNQPYIEQAIQAVAHDDPHVEAGFVPQVRTCDDYRDDIGHLEPEAKAPIAAEIGAYYRGV